jgi:hypothetical protein
MICGGNRWVYLPQEEGLPVEVVYSKNYIASKQDRDGADGRSEVPVDRAFTNP